MKHCLFVAALTVAVLGAVAAPARADMIFLSDTSLSGQGLGATLTVLTLQSPGNTTFESGGVAFDGTTFGTTQPGASKNRTFTYADLGIADAAQLALIVNLAEPMSERPPSVTAAPPFYLTLTVYDATGANHESFVYSCGTTENPCQLAAGEPGLGGSGLVFGLDAPQQLALNSFVAGHAGTEVFAVSASFESAQGGPDAVQAGVLTTTSNGPMARVPVPEPATLLLLGSGLLGAGYVARKKNR